MGWGGSLCFECGDLCPRPYNTSDLERCMYDARREWALQSEKSESGTSYIKLTTPFFGLLCGLNERIYISSDGKPWEIREAQALTDYCL